MKPIRWKGMQYYYASHHNYDKADFIKHNLQKLKEDFNEKRTEKVDQRQEIDR
jgi:hypothetical protein